MARKPEWFANIEGIRERLSSLHAEQMLGRADVEKLFDVKRTEAARILEVSGGLMPGQGRRAIVHAHELLAYVESRRGEVKKERKRRAAVAQVVAEESSISPARYSNFKLPKVPSFDELKGIRFSPGGTFYGTEFRDVATLSIDYGSFEDLMVKLVALGKAMLHQEGRFEEIVEKSLRP